MKKNTVLVIVSYMVHTIGLYAARPYLPLLSQDCGADSVQIGLIISALGVAQAAGALPASRLMERFGHRLVSIAGSLLFMAGAGGFLFARTLPLMALCAILTGLSHVMVVIWSQFLLTGTPPEERTRAVGCFSLANSAAIFVGPLIGGYLTQHLGPNAGFIGAFAAGTAALAPVLLVGRADPAGEGQRHGNPLLLIRQPRVIRNVIIGGMLYFSVDVVNTYLPLYGSRIGVGTAAIGTALSVYGVTQMLVRPLMYRITARIGTARTFWLCLLFGGVTTAAFGLVQRYETLLLVSALAGLAIGLANPLTLIAVSDAAPPQQRASALALRMMSNFAGQTLSPIVFGALAGAAGLAPVFFAGGAALLVCMFPQRREIRLTAEEGRGANT